jgi:cellulose synthase/poly-beta-1,6-N-acetylglucosamine synthase-like glycosyltransferase
MASSRLEEKHRISTLEAGIMTGVAFTIDSIQAFLVILNVIPIAGFFLHMFASGLLSVFGYLLFSFWFRMKNISVWDITVRHPFSSLSLIFLEFIGMLPLIGILFSFLPGLTIWVGRTIYLATKIDEEENKKKRDQNKKATAVRAMRQAANDNRPYRRPLTPAYEEAA